MYKGGYLKYLLFLSEFNQPRILFADFEISSNFKFKNMLTEGAVLFHADRQT